MGTVERRARERAAKRRDIQRAAIRCFGRDGYDRTTLEDVARAAEVAKGTLYLYFRSKADLFASLLLEQGFDVFAAALDRELARSAGPAEAIAAFCRCFRELCLEGRREIFEWFVQLERGDIARDLSPDLRAEARRRLEGILARIAAVADAGRRAGELEGPGGHRVALVFWAFCVGLAHLSKEGTLPGSGARPPDVLEDGAALLLRGLAPRG